VGTAKNRLEHYVDDKKGLKTVLEDLNSDGNQVKIANSHRFEQQYMKNTMGKFYALERESVARFGDDGLTMVMLTLSASPFDDDDRLIPPVDHLDSMMDADRGSWSSVRRGIHRALEGLEWEYARILEPHTPTGSYASAGYSHVHVGLFINDPAETLSEADFGGVLSSHVSNCPTASKTAHTVQNSVSLSRYDLDSDGGMGAYLTAYLGEQLDETVEDTSEYMKRYMAVLWASGRRRVSFSNGAQQWIKEDYEGGEDDKADTSGLGGVALGFRLLFDGPVDPPDDDDDDPHNWQMVGVERPNDDGEPEFIPCDPDSGGSYMGTVVLPKPAGQMPIADTSKPYSEHTLKIRPGLKENEGG
jgi:hypothetical protein